MKRPADTLSARLVLLGVVTASVSVIAAGAVGVQLVRSAAPAQAQADLARQADVVAGLAAGVAGTGQDELLAAVEELDRQDIEVSVARTTEPAPESLPASLLNDALVTGSAGGITGEEPTLTEARRIAPGTVLVLEREVRTAVAEVAAPVVRSLLLALLVGLVVAVAAGTLVARRLSRPLQRAGDAARRLSTGERDTRLAPEGPVEVAEVADALNGLADALAHSEGRQRNFLLSVSHELRTPLTAIRGYAEALADAVVTEDEARRAGEVIAAEADRLDELMSDLLALARAEADDFPLDLRDIDLAGIAADAALAWAEPARRAGVELVTQTRHETVVAVADPRRARQVLDALVANAIRVTPAGRPVVIAARMQADGRPALQVRDGGPGLTDDDLPVAFHQGVLSDRYQGVRPGGSGIGLALVERLTRRMGGSASAGHAPEGGAAFCVTFPSASSPTT